LGKLLHLNPGDLKKSMVIFSGVFMNTFWLNLQGKVRMTAVNSSHLFL
jgi:hypothetical protein